jgi:hypothetical protein
MTKTSPVPFPEFRRLLQRLGYVAKRHPSASVFEHPEEGLLTFRLYREEAVDEQDLIYTRKFLDLRGLMDAADFDAALLRADTPA